jgi:glucokinase
MAFLGIDLGGTYARAAVVDADGGILAACKRVLTDRSVDGVVGTLAEAAGEVLHAYPHVATCGVGVAGMLEGDTGVVAVAPNLGWRNVPFGALLAQRLGRPVRVVNDLSAAAWGEFRAGAGRGTGDILVVFVGSGVGSAIIATGRLLRGAGGAAGELGHVKVVPEGGRRCGCGETGCLEAYMGGHNLIAQMQELLESGEPTLLRELAAAPGALLSPVLLEEAALRGDAAAAALYDRAVGMLGVSTANLVTLLNPRALVIGGGVLSRCPAMRQRLAEGVQRYASRVSLRAVTVVDAALGDDSGLIGAALLGAGEGSR